MKKLELSQERLIQCREKLGISKYEAAKKIHISQPAYLRYESGERQPSFHIIQTIAEEFGTSVEYLTRQTDNPMPTTYLVKQAETPELFYLVDIYQKSDYEEKKRLCQYFEELTTIKKTDAKI